MGSMTLWSRDEDTKHCTQCRKSFSLSRRKHHCRSCGKIFCYKCSGSMIFLNSDDVCCPELIDCQKPQRCCDTCAERVRMKFMYSIDDKTVSTPVQLNAMEYADGTPFKLYLIKVPETDKFSKTVQLFLDNKTVTIAISQLIKGADRIIVKSNKPRPYSIEESDSNCLDCANCRYPNHICSTNCIKCGESLFVTG
eukprot:gene6300-8676_t